MFVFFLESWKLEHREAGYTDDEREQLDAGEHILISLFFSYLKAFLTIILLIDVRLDQ